MAMIIVRPPNPQEGRQSTGSVVPDCCSTDTAMRAALFCYLLTLLLKKVGGTDWTNCDDAIAEFETLTSYDEAHLELLEGEALSALLTAHGITVDETTATQTALCLKNNLPLWLLKATQFFLWNSVVNELTP